MISLIVVSLYHLFAQPPKGKPEVIIYSKFLENVEAGKVEEVTIQGENIEGKFKETTKTFKTHAPPQTLGLVDTLQKNGVRISAKPVDESPWYMTVLISWFPIILLIGVWLFFMRQMQGGGKAMSFGKSKARLIDADRGNKVTFADVAGITEAKAELEEVIDFLRDPRKFSRLGGKIPKGVLLVGSPGTGKTLLARAIAGEAGVPFLSISGSDFVEMFVGVGASRVRDLFEQGKKNAPCIIFVDEIDAVGRHRGAGLGGGHDEREQTLNQLLVEMDGFESNDGVIMVAATNRPDVLDPALLRPGRFDRQVIVPLPDVKGREEILKVHAKKIPISEDVDFEVIARGTPGFSGADIANLVNESALFAAREDRDSVTMADFEYAKDKVMMGAERRTMVISDVEKRSTAYHESGHTLVARFLPGSDPIHKVTIIPRGRALGLTQLLPIDEKHVYGKEYLLNNITILLGGRGADEVVNNSPTTGAGNDIERATTIARKMVCEWGMSPLGPLSYGKKEEQLFLGKELMTHKDYSEATAQRIDQEVERIVTECYERAKGIIIDNLTLLHLLAEKLLEKETLSATEIDELLKEKASGKNDDAMGTTSKKIGAKRPLRKKT